MNFSHLSCRANTPVRLGPRYLSLLLVCTEAENSKRFFDEVYPKRSRRAQNDKKP